MSFQLSFVAIDTPSGKIAAKAAIITVSSNVLVSGAIKFAPDFPKRQLDAASKLSLGSYDHIALQLPGNPTGLACDEMLEINEGLIAESEERSRVTLLWLERSVWGGLGIAIVLGGLGGWSWSRGLTRRAPAGSSTGTRSSAPENR